MATYQTHRQDPYFAYPKSGQKTIAGHVREDKYRLVRPGGYFRVDNHDDTEAVEVRVLRVANYRSFRELLETEPLKKVLPDVDSVDDGIKVYRQFYTPEQEKAFGVVALEVEVTKRLPSLSAAPRK